MSSSVIDRAEELTEGLLWPAAAATDAAGLVPRAHLDALAEAGLYGLAGPAAYGAWEST